MKIVHAEVIPHRQQRYNTVGDYFTQDFAEQFRISELGDEKMEHLVLLHELVERILCYHRGITNEQIDEFDEEHEMSQFPGEPGDAPSCPYRREHQVATIVERLIATELGVNWSDYERKVESLGQP